MKKIKLLEQFLDEQKIEEGLFDVVTKSKAFLRNPISATKITNNGKKLAQAQVDSAANELDFEKRKLAADKAAKAKIENLQKKGDKDGVQKVKDDYDDSKDVLKAAHDQKDEGLKDKVGSIGDRIDDLSKKNSTLQDLASLVKTAARVKKNEVLIKGADEEEKKQLKIQLQKDTEHIQDLQKGFGDYEASKDGEDKKPEDKKDFKVDTNVPEKPATAQSTEKPAATQSAAPTAADKPLTTTSSKPEDSKESPEDELARTRQDVQDQQRIISDHKSRIKGHEDKIADLKAGKYDKKTVTDPQAEIAKLQKNIETEKGDLEVANTELGDLVKASQDAEKKMPKKEPAAEAPKAEPAAEAPKNPVGRPKKEEPAAEAPKADSKRKEVEDQIAKDNAEPAKVTTDTKQYKIDKLEKDAKAAEDEHKKILLDPKYQEGVKKDKELQDKADSVDKELSAIDKEKDPSGYEAKMKEVQAANQVIKDFRKKFSEDNKDLEDKADAAEIKMRQLNKELQAAKEEAKKTPNESLTLLKSFNDFVSEKYKS
jgi:DNA repair exonuclease SbcCD ATPase subunit